jgi:predicted metal-dependent peptidase
MRSVYEKILSRIIRAKMTLLKESKILSNVSFVASTTINFVKQCDTACVYIKNKRYHIDFNAQYVSQLSDEELVAVLKHECFHIIFQHIDKRSRDPHIVWNIATDCAINQFIKNLPPNCVTIEGLAKRYSIPENEVKAFESSDFYFDLLMRHIPRIGLDELAKRIFDGMPVDMDGNGMPGVFVDVDAHTQGELDKILGGGKKNSLKDKLKDFLSKNPSKGCGKEVGTKIYEIIYADARKLVDILDKTLNQLIAQNRSSRKYPTRKKKNRRFGWSHPGYNREIDKRKVMIYIDASGSVSETQLKEFFKRVDKLHDVAEITVKAFDTRVGAVNFKKRKPVHLNGFGGGTDFDIVMDDFQKISPTYDGCLVFTDGQAGIPQRPLFHRKVIWVLYPNCKLGGYGDKDSAYGHIVEMAHQNHQ